MLTQSIRRQFIEYFKSKGHATVASSPVIPHDDPTLLFTNAGMNQFKEIFLGKNSRDYKRAVTCQKCIRAGGKHNDLDNVGHTTRHLTFFEMLGNFSFGDYFKKDAISFAWEVSTQILGFDPERIWPTVFRDDDEAFELWTAHVPSHRITRLGEKDNFWEMGDTGPCGPCSELYYDRGSDFGPAACLAEDPDGERYLEFWNLVFMQFNRQPDKTLVALPNPSIDTGAGLERIISLKMNVDSLFLTDIFQGLIHKIEEISGKRYVHTDEKLAPAFRVISDHLRSLSFAIADGAQPSNVERGYVLRKILRRAVRYGRMLGLDEPFLGKVLPRLVELMSSDYPELVTAQHKIAEILHTEEEAFLRTLQRGGNMLSQVIQRTEKHHKLISGEDAFKLKDTYGLPLEEIFLFAKDNHFTVDLRQYEILEQQARERSRRQPKTSQQTADQSLFSQLASKHGETTFTGYFEKSNNAQILAIIKEGSLVQEVSTGEEALILLDKTPFYAEMGGQVGDKGSISHASNFFQVNDAQSPYKGLTVHAGKLIEGVLKTGNTVQTSINHARRQQIANNHTATHLLHWALHEVLGEHVRQAGSVVDEERLRFDFSHHKPLTPQELAAIETLVNEKIRSNDEVKWYEIPYEQVQNQPKIRQFFGDKYGKIVRVVDINNYSQELCGGTHTVRTGDMGLFVIQKEGSIAAGVRRLEALTGQAAIDHLKNFEQTLIQIADLVKTKPVQLQDRLTKLMEENKVQAHEIKKLRQASLHEIIASLINNIETVNGIPLIITELSLNTEELRQCAEELISKLKTGIVILAAKDENRCQFLFRISDDIVKKGIDAVSLVKAIAPIIEGSGGGKPNNAQAGGKAPHKLLEAFNKIREHLK